MARIPYKTPPKKKIVAGAALAALLGLGAAQLSVEKVADFEGYVPYAYQCPAGVWTKCFGDTTNVTPGATYSFEECLASLNEHLVELSKPVLRCVPSLALMPDKVKVAAVSMAYNIGPGAFCGSSVARYFNAGDYERGCKRMAEIYTTAKGKEIPGLVVRRGAESEMCLQGLRGE
ncbi:MAG: lysozyme [Desulfovibrio sp.]|jgi:lysozyme|nr:lysozyme [Desulfovibrio sp.]